MIEEAYRDKGLIILIKSLLDQLDEVATLKASNNPAKISMELFKEMSKILIQLSDEDKKKYFDFLIILSENLSAPKNKSESVSDYAKHTELAKRKTISDIKKMLKVA